MEQLAFWPFIRRSLWRAASEAGALVGLDVQTVVVGAALLIVGFGLVWRIKGREALREETASFLLLTAIPVVGVFVLLFMMNIVRAPYLIYVDEQKKSISEISRLTRERDRFKAERDALKLSPAASSASFTPTEAAELVHLRERVKQLEAQVENKAQRRAVRTALAGFIEEAETLKRRCLATDPPPQEEANEWAARVEVYLRRNADESYVARFRKSNLPLQPDTPGLSKAQRSLWGGLNERVLNLSEIAADFSG